MSIPLTAPLDAQHGVDTNQPKLKLAGATDESVRHEDEEALNTLREQADHLKRMNNLLERFKTQLTTLTSTLESVQANAIRLQTVDEDTIRAEIPVQAGAGQRLGQRWVKIAVHRLRVRGGDDIFALKFWKFREVHRFADEGSRPL